MAIKWIKEEFEWGARHISNETQCVIEDHKKHGINLWGEPGKSALAGKRFDTVRAAKSHVNKLAS